MNRHVIGRHNCSTYMQIRNTIMLLMLTAGTVCSQVEVKFFLSPTCMICRYYALEMRSLHEDYSNSGVKFSGHVVGPLFNDSIADAFRREYEIPFAVHFDNSLHWQLNATVTPEVFLISQGKVLYHGRIDDSFVRVGKRRTHVKNRELRASLDAVLRGDVVEVNCVPAVGCIIEK